MDGISYNVKYVIVDKNVPFAICAVEDFHKLVKKFLMEDGQVMKCVDAYTIDIYDRYNLYLVKIPYLCRTVKLFQVPIMERRIVSNYAE